MSGIGRRKARPGKLIVNWRDGGGVRRYKEFPDTKAGEHEAREHLVREVNLAKTGKVAPNDRLTLRDYYETWMQATSAGLASNTVRNRRSTFETHVLPNFGASPLVRLNRSVLRGFLASLLEKGYANATVSCVLTNLGCLFEYAVDSGDLEVNPVARLARRMNLGWSPENILSMSRDELGQFLAATREGPESFSLSLLAFSGLRISEALGLQWQDVDFGENLLRVERQIHQTGEVAKLKTVNAKRAVEVPASLVDAIRERASLPRRGPWLLAPTWELSVRAGQSSSRRKQIRGAMGEALRLASLPDHFSPHSLRHTFARLHLEGGRQLLWVSRQLGHASIAITADRYARFARLKGEGAADALAASVEGVTLRQKVVPIR